MFIENTDCTKKKLIGITDGTQSSQTSTLTRSNARARHLNSITRERGRQIRSSREMSRNNTVQNNNMIVPQQVEIISLLSDDEDGHDNNGNDAEDNESNGNTMQVIKLNIILFTNVIIIITVNWL